LLFYQTTLSYSGLNSVILCLSLSYSGLNSVILVSTQVFRFAARSTLTLFFISGEANCCCVAGERKPEVLGFLFLMGLGLAGLRRAPRAMSTTSRLENSSRQLVGRLARKVESDSPVGIPGAPGRLVADLKTEQIIKHKLQCWDIRTYEMRKRCTNNRDTWMHPSSPNHTNYIITTSSTRHQGPLVDSPDYKQAHSSP
jgi:hypothetical protein